MLIMPCAPCICPKTCSFGFILAALSLVGIVVAILVRVFGGAIQGQGTTLIVVLFLGGIQLIFLGIIGEYLGRIYDEVKQRPLYVVARSRNLDPEEGAAAALAGVDRGDPEAP